MKRVHSAAYKLFHYPYLFRFPENEAFDVNDTEYFGRETTGNAEWDKNLASAMGERYLHPAEAAAMAARGVRIELVDPKDAIVIYEMICEHINNWLKHLEATALMGVRKPPVEGLREFNTFARGLARVGRRFGLVDMQDPYAVQRRRRNFRLEHRATMNLQDFEHADYAINRVIELARVRK